MASFLHVINLYRRLVSIQLFKLFQSQSTVCVTFSQSPFNPEYFFCIGELFLCPVYASNVFRLALGDSLSINQSINPHNHSYMYKQVLYPKVQVVSKLWMINSSWKLSTTSTVHQPRKTPNGGWRIQWYVSMPNQS